MLKQFSVLAFLCGLLSLVINPCTARPVEAVGYPVLDPPTLRCLGFYWIIPDGYAHWAKVRVEYQKSGTALWKQGAPLFRVQNGPFKGENGKLKPPAVAVPEGTHLYAGSLFLLEPDTAYNVRLTLTGGSSTVEGFLHARTIAEPVAPPNMRLRHVIPGTGGGSGTATDPFRGLNSAGASAQPGDLFLVHKGVYEAPFYIRKSGEPGHPVIWRGEGNDLTIIDAKRPHNNLTDHAVEARGVHDVWFEKLSICNAYSAICGHESSRLVVQRCHLYGVLCGVLATRDDTDQIIGFFISDNLIEGIMPWPATEKQWHELPESRGIWITGRGHVVCYNRIRNCKDGIDLDECRACVANDFHNNDVSQMFDDGSEMDGSDRNTRNFLNRYTNVLCGISFQPVHGGPVYAFRNVFYNVRNEPFKLHNSPSGAVLIHNTVLRSGSPLKVYTPEPFYNCYSRNNLFVGTGGRAYDCNTPSEGCDFDYDGFAGWSGPAFFKWNNVKYATPADVRAQCPVEKHLSVLDAATLFASGLQAPVNELTVFDASNVDASLNPKGGAVNAGQPLPGFDDGFRGRAPDLGAYELGGEVPHYGPRPEK